MMAELDPRMVQIINAEAAARIRELEEEVAATEACTVPADKYLTALNCIRELKAEVERLRCRIENEIGGGLGSMDKGLWGYDGILNVTVKKANRRLKVRIHELKAKLSTASAALMSSHDRIEDLEAEVGRLQMDCMNETERADFNCDTGIDEAGEVERLTLRCEAAREIISEMDSLSNRVASWLEGRP
ncbi:MAG: hypothetical protein ABIH23_05875 [bacterium]